MTNTQEQTYQVELKGDKVYIHPVGDYSYTWGWIITDDLADGSIFTRKEIESVIPFSDGWNLVKWNRAIVK